MQAVGSRPSVLSGIVGVLGIIPFIGLLMFIYHSLHIDVSYFGFLFLLYWMAIRQQAGAEYLPAVLGGLCGIGLAWILLTVPGMLGVAGYVIGLTLLAVVLFLYIRRQALLVVNNAMMLFLAVAAIPEIKVSQNAPMFEASLLVSALYCGAFVAGMNWIAKRRAAAA
jgi:hypothetical protein